ncbi:NUDIX domain-containing protein [Pseudomonas kielensis]|uniref:NUDIX hydrolase n=1 Tax=Pseudomonas kielensis TaxID=2762577 RepID=UPI0022406C66|nr:NUDIX domain-containing protein [Pseudomonas kielensis]UZM13960.1 NUDIX domain-containing protein [Pseudomonas kielensis]
MEYRDLPCRKNVRTLLLNPHNQILLMKVALPDRTFWCTLGGGIHPDESLEQAAQRELFEEAGYRPEELSRGHLVWKGQHILMRDGTLFLLDESFLLYRVTRVDFTTLHQTDEEKAVVKELRWWALEEINSTRQHIVPPRLGEHLQRLLAQGPPSSPELIQLADES